MLDHPPIEVYKRLSDNSHTTPLTMPLLRGKQLWQGILAVSREQVWSLRTVVMAGVALALSRIALPVEVHPFVLPVIAVAATFKARGRGLLVTLAALLGLATTASWLIILPYLIVAGLLFAEIRTEEQAVQRYKFTIPLLAAVNLWLVRTLMIILLGQAWLALVPVTLEAVLTYALTTLLWHLSSLKKELVLRKGLSRSETAALVVVMTAAVEGLHGLAVGPVRLHEVVQWWLVMIAAWLTGPGGGGAVGVTVAIIEAAFGEGGLVHLFPYAVSGVTGGLFVDRGKPGVLLGGLLGILLCGAQAVSRWELGNYFLHGGLVLGLILLTPPLRVKQVGRLIRNTAEFERMVRTQWRQLREQVGRQLQETSQVFAELAETFAETASLEEGKPDAGVLLSAVIQRACTGCERKGECWEKNFYANYRDFLELLSLAEVSGSASLIDVPPRLRVHCPSTHRLVSAVNYLLDVYRLNTAWEQRLAESREVVASQFQGVSQIMQKLSHRIGQGSETRGQMEEKLLQAMEAAHLPVQYVGIAEIAENQQAVEVVLESCHRPGLCRQEIPGIIEQCLGRSVAPISLPCEKQSCLPEGTCVLHFVPQRVFELGVRVATASKEKGKTCGDRYACLELPGGKVAVLLSDGMGTGERAAAESETAVNMLAQLIRAGFERDFAVRTVNSALLLRSREDNFATMDLLITDLYTGKAEFIKVGAAPTYIRRKNEVFVVRQASLPVGILNSIEVETVEWYLRPGDLVVMLTDGILEAGGLNGGDDWLRKILLQIEDDNPAQIAATLLQKARERRGRSGDDMTVIAAKLTLRKS